MDSDGGSSQLTNFDRSQGHIELEQQERHPQSSRLEGQWVRWAIPLILGLAVSAFVAVMAIRDKVSDLNSRISIIEVKEDIGQSQRNELVSSMREQASLVGQLRETIVRLTSKVDELIDERRPSAQRRGAVFPDQRSGTFDK